MAGTRKPARNLDDHLYLEDLDESLLSSPAKKIPVRSIPSHSRQTSTQQSRPPHGLTNEQHEANLRQELASVRKVNEAMEGVLESLEKAKNNMKNVNQTVNNASSLLNIWTRILSQTEHNQRLILDPSWQGASQDITDMEEEEQAKQQATERREAEEQERKAAAARKLEDEERRRAEAATSVAAKPKPVTRGRGGLSRGSTSSRAGYVTMGGTTTANTGGSTSTRGTTATRRTTSGIGRGVSRGTRGRT